MGCAMRTTQKRPTFVSKMKLALHSGVAAVLVLPSVFGVLLWWSAPVAAAGVGVGSRNNPIVADDLVVF